MRPIEALIPYVRNPRKNDQAVDRMCASIREFGFKIPVLSKSDGTVIDGHLRLKAAHKLNLREVPVILCDDWTEAQVKAFRLLANRSVEWADWDEDLLTMELSDLREMDFDLSLTGFDLPEISDLLDSINTNVDTEGSIDDEIPDIAIEPITRRGDLWQLGRHRLQCGDSRNADDVNTVMAGDRASLCFTSPPYAQQRNYTTAGVSDWDALMQCVFCTLPMEDDGQVLVNLG